MRRGAVPIFVNTALSISFVLLLMVGLASVKAQYDGDSAYLSGYGTSDLPKSDAQLWTRNALRLFFGFPPEAELPRFYASVMLGSLFALSGSLTAIILLPVLLLLFAVNTHFFLGNLRERWLLFGLTALLFWLAPKTLLPLNPGSLMIDFLAFTLGLMAVFLMWQGCKQEEPHWPMILLALGYLGSVCAIRGIPILTGLGWIACVNIWFRQTLTKTRFGLVCLIYLLPVLSESLFHYYYGIHSNLADAIWSLTVPPHTWTYIGHLEWIQQWQVNKTITPADIYQRYGHFVFSLKGISIIWSLILERLYNDLRPLITFTIQPQPISFLAGFYMLGQLFSYASPFFKTPSRWVPSLLGGIMLLLFAIGDNFLPPLFLASIVLFGLMGILLVAIYYRMIFLAILLSYYLGSLLVFVLLGSAGEERTAATYHYTLYLAMLTLMFQPAMGTALAATAKTTAKPDGFATVAVLHGLILLFLYTGVYLWSNSISGQLRQAAQQNPQIAMKIAAYPPLNRALYFNAQGQIFLTQNDHFALQQIIFFRELLTHPPYPVFMNPKLSTNDWFFNVSLHQPYTFVGARPLKITP